jgi:hypothetical protein
MLKAARCVIIPDIHQNVAWASGILEREKNCDLAVFLGDYFDRSGKPGSYASTDATCDWLAQVRQEWSGRSIFLLGNHDVQYLEAKMACDLRRQPRNQSYQCGGAFSAATAQTVAKRLPARFWTEARLFAAVNDHLLSHAGLALRFWPKAGTPGRALAALQRECAVALATIPQGPHRLLDIGRARGGYAAIGGLTWLDWNDEFADDLPLPQIVGHTGDEGGARQNGRSWCIDGRQTCYGILKPTSFEVWEG